MESLFYSCMKSAAAAILKLLYRPQYEGLENIPADGKIILAGNHTNFLDCVLIASSTKRCVHFIAKAELLKSKIGRFAFTRLGIIPLDRSTNGKAAVTTAEEYLNDGKLIAIFPEGTINRTNDIMMPFKGGAVKIAADADCRIVPFAITGKYKPFRKNIKIKFMPSIESQKGHLKDANNLLYSTVRAELEKAGGK